MVGKTVVEMVSLMAEMKVFEMENYQERTDKQTGGVMDASQVAQKDAQLVGSQVAEQVGQSELMRVFEWAIGQVEMMVGQWNEYLVFNYLMFICE